MSDEYAAAIEEIRDSKRVLLAFSDDHPGTPMVQNALRLVEHLEEGAALMAGREDLMEPAVKDEFIDSNKLIRETCEHLVDHAVHMATEH
ncbi:hypothetical protein [Streptomyces nigrescens]|uniref:hypothetical protein n=1 Tax=Streptomyces nigrescens TaxID=1920 RepID=UPI0036FA9748